MAYKYDPYKDAEKIWSLKGQWDAGDEAQKKKAQEEAEGVYKNLRKNGYSNVADRLSQSNTNDAKSYIDSLKTSGMTGMRNGLVDELTGRYGMSEKEANERIRYDKDTGDVFLGSVNVGRGDVFVNDTNYVKDPSRLTNAVDEYARRNGLYPSFEKGADKNFKEASDKINSLWGYYSDDRETANKYYQKALDYLYTPFTDTKEYRAIMDGYKELGENAGYAAIASGAGANGGNIDSFAAAQAARQMKSFENAGNAAALNFYQSRVNSILGTNELYDSSRSQSVDDGLKIIGTQMALGQQYFDNNEKRRLNDNAIENDRAARTGIQSLQDILSNHPYLNPDGTLKEDHKDDDFQDLINKAPDEYTKNQLKQARWVKMHNDPELMAKYGDTLEAPTYYLPTEARRKAEQDSADLRYQIDENSKLEQRLSDNALKGLMEQYATERYGYDIQAIMNYLLAYNPNMTVKELKDLFSSFGAGGN